MRGGRGRARAALGVLGLMSVAATVAACSGSGSSASRSPAPPSSPAGTVAPTGAAGAPATVPSVLVGVWHTSYQGDDQKLAFTTTGYSVYTDPSDEATGTAVVAGSTLTLSGSDTCPGVGRYHWQVNGGALRLSALGTDPCPRADLLPGRAWTRVGSG